MALVKREVSPEKLTLWFLGKKVNSSISWDYIAQRHENCEAKYREQRLLQQMAY